MIILDTNVISEMMRPSPSSAVREWLDAQRIETLYLTTITVSELLYGVAALPAGKRKDRLGRYVEELMSIFEERILSFDLRSALTHAELVITAKNSGKGFPIPDAYLAAIAAANQFAVATRDTAPFASVGLVAINPWSM